jgi:Ca-activated chloride channel family protein
MQVSAHLDVDLVAVEQPDEVTLLLELEAPAAEPDPAAPPRPPATVQVVLDRSGSMAGERLEAALGALCALVGRLAPDDRLGVVAFDDEARVIVPCGPVADRDAVRALVRGVVPGGTTNLSAGLLRGLQEARRAAGPAGATLLLVSDGHANAGVVDADALEHVATTAHGRGIAVATIGVGLGYDARLLSALARGGGGEHAFAEDGDAAAGALAGQVEGLLSRTVQAASLTVRPAAAVETVHVHNDLPAHPVPGGVAVELGDLWAGERRRVLLTLGVPAVPALGLALVAELELRAVALLALAEQVVTLPVHVNVVPGDQAAGRVPDPTVVTELLFQRAQDAKRRAADRLDAGDAPGALACYADARADLAAGPASPELRAEGDLLDRLAGRAATDGAWAARASRSDHARKSRKRGR